MNKKFIRLTESDLHRIVKESVRRILREDDMDDSISDKEWQDIYSSYYDSGLGNDEPNPEMRDFENRHSWAEDWSKDEDDKWIANKLHNPEAHRNLNVFDGKGQKAMASMATNEEDPTGAIRTYGRGSRGTTDSVLKALMKKYPNGIKEPVKWPKKW